MNESRYLLEPGKRLRLFELAIVLLVIALLIYIGASFYQKPTNESSDALANVHLSVFSRMMSNIHAMGSSNTQGFVEIDSVRFYLNERGWPSNTDAGLSPSLRNQTAKECQQVWNAAFTLAPQSSIEDAGYNKKIKYKISLNKNVICRYELLGKQEASYFLDYDVSNGAVVVVRP